MRRVLLSAVTSFAMVVAMLVVAPATTAAPAGTSAFVAVAPVRLLDTRNGIGVASGVVQPGKTMVVPVVGHGPIPSSGVTAIALNVTTTNTIGPGFVQVFPTGGAQVGDSSNINVGAARETVPNLVIVPVGADGTVSMYSGGGGNLIADALGYFTTSGATSAGRYKPLNPIRLLDTRSQAPGRLAPRGSVVVPITASGGVPSTGVAAAVLNVTAVDATNPGFVQVIPTGGATAIGASSNLNVQRAAQTVPNLVIVPVGADGSITVYSESGTHLIVDVFGYFTDASVAPGDDGLFVPVAPGRILDTRGGTKPAANATVTVAPLGQRGVPVNGVAAVVTNLTATNAVDAGYVQALPGTTVADIGRPSNLNIDHRGQTVANAAIANLGGGTFALHASVSTDLLADVSGYFTTATPPPTVLLTSPSSGTVNANQTLTAEITGSGVLGVQFKVDGNNVGAEVTAAPYTTSWASASVPNGSHVVTAVARTADAMLTSNAAMLAVRNALVTFTFDDGWRSQFTTAAPMLASFGFPATYFPISGFLTDPPYMVPTDLQSLHDSGNEIGSHTKDHCSLIANTDPACPGTADANLLLTPAEITTELQHPIDTLGTLGLGPINNFASPYGDMDTPSGPVITEVKTKYRSHRGVQEGLNGVGYNRYDLLVHGVYGTTVTGPDGHPATNTALVQNWIDEARTSALSTGVGWMILVFHEVTLTPSGRDGVGAPSFEYTVSPANFEAIAQSAANAGVRVVTVNQALDETNSFAAASTFAPGSADALGNVPVSRPLNVTAHREPIYCVLTRPLKAAA